MRRTLALRPRAGRLRLQRLDDLVLRRLHLRDRRQRHQPGGVGRSRTGRGRAHHAGERRGRVADRAVELATVDDQTDTDGDFQPDDATYTFALPACSFTGFRGGRLDVTGTSP